MKIETKFEIGQEIYCLKGLSYDGGYNHLKIRKGTITGICYDYRSRYHLQPPTDVTYYYVLLDDNLSFDSKIKTCEIFTTKEEAEEVLNKYVKIKVGGIEK